MESALWAAVKAHRPRVHVRNRTYPVKLQDNAGQHIFLEQEDRDKIYRLLIEATVRFAYHVHSCWLMGNPAHPALQFGGIPRSRGMP
jgi:hypothetical protein